jgi:hypothetical protein
LIYQKIKVVNYNFILQKSKVNIPNYARCGFYLRRVQYAPAKFCGQVHLTEGVLKYVVDEQTPPLQVLNRLAQLRLEAEAEQRPQVFLQYC